MALGAAGLALLLWCSTRALGRPPRENATRACPASESHALWRLPGLADALEGGGGGGGGGARRARNASGARDRAAAGPSAAGPALAAWAGRVAFLRVQKVGGTSVHGLCHAQVRVIMLLLLLILMILIIQTLLTLPLLRIILLVLILPTTLPLTATCSSRASRSRSRTSRRASGSAR